MIRILCTYLCFLACFTTGAQGREILTNYNVNDGMPQSSIYDIIQDKNGFLWVGTAGGLCRFDGYQFKVYKTSAQDPHAISGYKEFRFYNDSSGRMWIVSFNGISVYNSVTDNFTNVLVYSPQNVVIAENHFYGEDKDFIWIGLCSYGIVKVNKHTLKVESTPLTRTTHRASNNVGYHGFLENGKLWIVENNESANYVFLRYDTKTQRADTVPMALTGLINMNDSMALGLTLTTAVPINKRTLAHRVIRINENGSEHNANGAYRQTASEAVITSSTQGLFYVDIISDKLIRHTAFVDPETKKVALYARCVYKDASGNTWIGTRGEGIYRVRYPFKKFGSYQTDITKNQNVFGVYADEQNAYVGFLTQGLTRFSRANGSVANITVNRQLPSALNNAYTMSAIGKDKLLIIATSSENNGCSVPFVYTKSSGKIELLNKEVLQAFRSHWGRGNLRNFLFRDADGNYVLNTGEYVIALHPANRENYFVPEVLNRFAGEALTCGFCDRDGNVWIGSFTGLFTKGKKGWERVNLPRNKEIKSISQDPDGNLWMGSNDEIFVMNQDHKVIRSFTEDDSLVNAHIYGILRDDDGNMWFSHNKGLSVYRWREKKFEHFDASHGLASTEFNIGAYFKSADGELFFGGVSGLTAFYPREILRNPNAPQAKITGIKVFDEPYRTDTAYWNVHSIKLPYTENSISFEFVLPEYTNQLKNTYEFMMENVDKKWIHAGDRRFTRYAGLRPGHYRFKVKGANNDGVYGNETTVSIYIVPPFWQRTWFIFLMILAFIFISFGAGILIQKFRQRRAMRVMELQHKIQLERERISRDLHDNVGTQLSLINKNLESVIDPLQDISVEEKMRNLGTISQTSRQVIFTLRETIWALNRETISLEELSDKLKGFTQKLFEMTHSCRLLFTEDIDDADVILSPSEAIHLFRICQEAITNSLKYANAGLMEIRISSVKDKYEVVIADDGIGFEKDIKKSSPHYGLDNMQFRAGEINCEFVIESATGKGTKIIIRKK